MPRRPRADIESIEELARKVAILERELALQREALEKLKQMGPAPRRAPESTSPARKSA
jgi:hypothetical protein